MGENLQPFVERTAAHLQLQQKAQRACGNGNAFCNTLYKARLIPPAIKPNFTANTIKHDPFMRQKIYEFFIAALAFALKFNCLCESFLFMMFVGATLSLSSLEWLCPVRGKTEFIAQKWNLKNSFSPDELFPPHFQKPPAAKHIANDVMNVLWLCHDGFRLCHPHNTKDDTVKKN